MSTATRRGFLAGAASTALVPSLANAQTAAPTAPGRTKGKVRYHGRAIAASPRGQKLVVAHERRRTVQIISRGRRRLVDVGGQPLEVAISPDGRLAAVTTASWDEPGLAIVDLRSGKRRRRVDAGPAPFALAFSPDGTHLIVAGGEQEGEVRVLGAKSLEPVAQAALGIVPRGIAARAGEAWIALNGLDEVVRVNLADAAITRTISTPPLPDRIAVSRDGRRLLVSHGGRDPGEVSEIDVSSGRVKRLRAGRQPSAVAWGPRGSRLVALGGSGEILSISASGARRRRAVGGAPRGLAVAGRRAWTVDHLTGRVSAITL